MSGKKEDNSEAQNRKTFGKLVAVVSNELKSAVGGSREVILLTLPEDTILKEINEAELYDLMLTTPNITNVTFHRYPHEEKERQLKIEII